MREHFIHSCSRPGQALRFTSDVEQHQEIRSYLDKHRVHDQVQLWSKTARHVTCNKLIHQLLFQTIRDVTFDD